MATTKVSSKGWVVIPAPLRRKYEIRPGSELAVVDYGGVLALVPVEAGVSPVKAARGVLKSQNSLTASLLQERQREREREKAR